MKLGLCALALLLSAGTPQVQAVGATAAPSSRAAFAPPDPAEFGNRLESGDIVQVRAWLNAGLHPDYLPDHLGTGLMIAAWRADIPMMELLLSRGADVNKANALGERALMHAAWRGHADAVRWLLARGARINSDPMHWSALHYAAFAGHVEVVALLLERGADIEARSTNGSSVLMMAVYEGHEQLVRQLLARGADRSVKNDRGDGALEWAFKFQRLAIARLVGTPQEFVAAANLPKSQWGEPVRSQPAPTSPLEPPQSKPANAMAGQIDELMRIRNLLAARGLADAANKLDRRIAALRAQRARADRATTPAAVLEISASRASPGDQRMRLIFGSDGPPP
jgi:ankyrin repeat protein